jgi:4-amino-4-deoxy-L-arabinose transferase-like glycosyltransferase
VTVASPWAALAKGPRAWLALVAFCLIAFLPGFFVVPPMDRDESRFAQASRQMTETGNWVDIRFQETARHKKPVGIYWLQATALSALGESWANPIWVYRLSSLMGAIAAVLLCFGLGRILFGSETAFAAALLLGAALVLGAEARLAKTDAALLGCLLVAQLALARIYMDGRAGRTAPAWAPWVFWLGQGLGILIKGPIVPMVSALTAVTLSLADRRNPDRLRWWRALRPIPAALLAVAIVVPWVVAISIETKGGFMRESVGGDLVPKLLAGEESHGAPPGFYLALFTLTFWPGSLLALAAVPWAWAKRAEPAVRFCLAWIVPAWLVFEVVPTKLPHYTLPTYPAIALLAAAALTAWGGAWPKGLWPRLALGWWALVTLALGGALAAFGFVMDAAPNWGGLAAGLAALALGAAAVRATFAAGDGRLLAHLVVLGLVVQGLAFQAGLPSSHAFWLSRSVGEAVRAAGEGPRPIVASAGYTEPSLVFTLGTATRLVPGDQAADLLADGAVALALVDAEHRAAFEARAADRGIALRAPVIIDGFNYSRGKPTTLALFARARP